MTNSHPTKEVQCSMCNKTWMKRIDGLKKWTGLCHSCSSKRKMRGNKFTLGHKLTEEHKKKISESGIGKQAGKKHPMFGKHHREEIKKKISEGVKEAFTFEIRKKMGDSHRGNKSSTWKGGISNKNQLIRSSFEIKLWHKACLERDNFTCQKTYQIGGQLQVHHINNFADFPELRTSIENGITLSKQSHFEFHKIYGRKNNSREQLLEFLNKK